MKRDARLRGLSSEHHHALVLAREVLARADSWRPEDGAVLGERFDTELEPHFKVEEALLLPALERVGASRLAQRMADDHASLRLHVTTARTGDARAARTFAERLGKHVRFEERELFPACETLLADVVLDEVARRTATPD